MVAPCTCFLDDNEVYRKIEQPFFSEYGVNNLFHPTMNFFVPRKFVRNIGTVFSNLDSPLDATAHHTMGKHLPSFLPSNPITPAIIHLRKAGGFFHNIERYTKFLDGPGRNLYTSLDATVGEAVACVNRHPKWVIKNQGLCCKVKEVSNIFASVIQRNKCLEAGIDELACINELPCCVTIAGDTQQQQ